MSTRPTKTAIALWLLASVCLALSLVILEDTVARGIALLGYCTFQGAVLLSQHGARGAR